MYENIITTTFAYLDVQDKMEWLTKEVHSLVLTTDFMKRHDKALDKAVRRISNAQDELLIQEFISRLSYKLPKLRLGVKLNDFDTKRARLIAAGIIANILMDNGTIPVKKEVKAVFVDGQKKFKTFSYMVTGGNYTADLFQGIEIDAGVVNQKELEGWKLSGPERAFLRKVASVPFCISDICTPELLWKGYSLKVDWDKTHDKNGNRLPEDPIMRKKRYELYMDKIINHVKPLPQFFLPAKYCTRDRVYYEATRLEGMRPHGKLWETLMLDAAEARMLTERDVQVLRHIIYVTLHGRVSVEEANRLISEEDLLGALAADPLLQSDEDSFGKAVLLNKAYQALEDYATGTPSGFLFGYDFTNSGLLMAGVSFHSKEMMKAANMGGESTVYDSHTEFGNAYDLPIDRKEVKKIHMGLLHGSTEKVIAQELDSVLGDDVTVTEEMVHKFNEKAYGPAVHNITTIADWGTQAVGNKQSILRWTLPDGFHASSRSYMKAVPIDMYIASASHKDSYCRYIVVVDMPLLEDSQGFPVYDQHTQVGGSSYPVTVKRRGLYANITHSIDAYMLRYVTEAVLDAGMPILLKHDDFIAPPAAYDVIKTAAKEVFDDMYYSNFYQDALNEIAGHSPYEGLEAPTLIEGDADFTVWKSENFLMP